MTSGCTQLGQWYGGARDATNKRLKRESERPLAIARRKSKRSRWSLNYGTRIPTTKHTIPQEANSAEPMSG